MPFFIDKNKSLENDLRIALANMLRNREGAAHDQFRSEAVMNAMDEAIILGGVSGEVIFINRKAVVNFGLQHVNYSDLKMYDLLQKIITECQIADNPKFIELISSVSGEQSLIAETVTLELHKPQIYLKLHTAPIHDDRFGYLGRVWKFEDQTAAIELDKMKTDFISVASHQLRTPVSAIAGYSEMIMSGDFGAVSDNLKEPLQAINQASKQITNLVNDLLNTSRLEQEKTKPKISEFDIVEIINQEVEAQLITATEKGVRIIICNPETRFEIVSDPFILRECFKNYLSNAIKYSPTGTIVTILIEVVNETLRVTVSDHGIGIPTIAQPHIFEKMFRADNVLMENFEGTGLGLYYVKQAIKLLGGDVGFSSTENVGSSFWFTIPIDSDQPAN